MPVATALVAANDPLPQLAEKAVALAMEKAGLHQCRGVLLYLSEHFRRDPQPALIAAAKAGRCLQVAGALAEGVFTEAGWVMDRPAAAALVLGGEFGLGPAADDQSPLLSFGAGNGVAGYSLMRPRFGFLQAQTGHWHHGRANPQPLSEVEILGARASFALASGWRPLSPALAVGEHQGLELLTVDRKSAQESLLRYLPPEQREQAPLPLHQIAALIPDPGIDPEVALSQGRYTPLSLLGSNPAGHLTLSSRLPAKAQIIWALRQSFGAEGEMQAALKLVLENTPPAFGLMSSCAGRGPGFYGGEDRDLRAWQECCPDIPLLGAYASGQFWPAPGATRVLHNAAVTTLLRKVESDV